MADDYEALIPWKMATRTLVRESQLHSDESLFCHPGSQKRFIDHGKAELLIEAQRAHPRFSSDEFGIRAFGIRDAVSGERGTNSAVSTLELYDHATKAPRLTAAFAGSVAADRAQVDEETVAN